MAERCTVVLFGGTSFTADLRARLGSAPWLELVSVDATLPSATQQLTTLSPDVVLFDLANPHAEHVIPMFQQRPGLPVVGLDLGSHQSRMWFQSVLLARRACPRPRPYAAPPLARN
jgi:hypothetical protein